ncbi:hypothetical protein, conserved [Babesia bigemina]|uniref:Uncharacterized protein n=1 Tax=Babesia bigemina TaxID=5866 RepID=A0A061BPF5_BABBI|nr:hypothetical protein, conserved [Babesia bigemina]CDR71395.1 hypothetical protein, conserved [Babesia bigemina]|eukprot:XP_012770345.1 hypothetical protein, conserved [Babesia bigemina]
MRGLGVAVVVLQLRGVGAAVVEGTGSGSVEGTGSGKMSDWTPPWDVTNIVVYVPVSEFRA